MFQCKLKMYFMSHVLRSLFFFLKRFESAAVIQKQSCSNTKADLTCLWLNFVATVHDTIS